MHVHEFAKECNFSAVGIGGTLPATAEYRKKLGSIHPSQLLVSNIMIPVYEIKFSYETMNDKKKYATKYILEGNGTEDEEEYEFSIMIQFKLDDWMEDHNRNHEKERQIKNVQYISCNKMAYAYLPLAAV